MRFPGTMLIAMVLACLVAAGCGDDDKSTGPEENPLVGTWAVQESLDDEEGEGIFGGATTMTFEDDGSMTITVGESGFSIDLAGTWSAVGNRLTLGFRGGVFSYDIQGGELTFATVEAGLSGLADYSFETGGDHGGALTGVTWVDEDDDELVFYSDGTYRWGEDIEEGTWTAEGRAIAVYLTSSLQYAISGNTLTLTNSDGEEIVLKKE